MMILSETVLGRGLSLLCAGLLVAGLALPRPVLAADDAGALYRRGKVLLESFDAKEEKQGLQLCEQAAAKGNADAQYELGRYYRAGGGDPTKRDRKKARNYFTMAAEQGHTEAQYEAGMLYLHGPGMYPDSKAAGFLEQAAAKGHVEAQVELAALYTKEKNDLPLDYAKARSLYAQAARAGNARAMNDLGVLYDNGQGGPRDYAKAVELFSKAAEKGLAVAMANMGEKYANGQGVARDLDRAVEWYERAMENGFDATASLKKVKELRKNEADRVAREKEARLAEEKARREQAAREEKEKREKAARAERARKAKEVAEERELERQRNIRDNVPDLPLTDAQLTVVARTATGAYPARTLLITCKVDEITIYDIVVNRGNMQVDGRMFLPVTLKYGQQLERRVLGQGAILEAKVFSDRGVGSYAWSN